MQQILTGGIPIQRAKATACVLAVILGLTGCAQIPKLEKSATLKPMEQYSSNESLKGQSAVWPQDQWWRSYGDKQLDELIEEGLKDSPTMTIAEARLRRALAMTQVADSASQPQVGAVAIPTMQKQSYNHIIPRSQLPQGWNDYGFAALSFNWEIDFWGKNKAALAAATSMQEATAADTAQARLALASSIANAYGELARLHSLHDNAKAAGFVRLRTLDLLKLRHEHGMEMLGNIKQASARLAAAEEDVLALEEQLSLKRNQIAALLGAGPDRGAQIKRPSVNVARNFALPQQLQLDLLGRRPDIVAAKWRVEALDKNVQRQKAEFYPNVNLSAMIGLNTLGLNQLTKSGSSFGAVGPAISLPIFTGGRLQGQLRGAHADYEEAIGTYNQTVTQALQEVADAAVNQRSLMQQIQKLEEAVTAAGEAHSIMKSRYAGGLSSYLEVLSAEEVLLQSQRALRDVQSRSFTIDVALIKALGGGYQNSDTSTSKSDVLK